MCVGFVRLCVCVQVSKQDCMYSIVCVCVCAGVRPQRPGLLAAFSMCVRVCVFMSAFATHTVTGSGGAMFYS